MNLKGKLFVFEGPDAAGKSSLSEHFVDWIQRDGKAVESLSFPGMTPGTLGDLVYRIHHDPLSLSLERLTASSLQALHIAAHLDTIETKIIPSLEAGKTVVLDRYWWSTRVYGLAAGVREELLDKLIEAEKIAWGGWLPTALFCISRSSPLRDEEADNWSSWKNGYDMMVQRESGNYPIHSIRNETSIEDSLSEIKLLCSLSS